jgi:hypothetical protein
LRQVLLHHHFVVGRDIGEADDADDVTRVRRDERADVLARQISRRAHEARLAVGGQEFHVVVNSGQRTQSDVDQTRIRFGRDRNVNVGDAAERRIGFRLLNLFVFDEAGAVRESGRFADDDRAGLLFFEDRVGDGSGRRFSRAVACL